MEDILRSLTAAVETMMNVQTPHQQRLEAYQACEVFKETSPHCAQCGLQMSSQDRPAIIRHFGLQLLEHCVRERWYKMSPQEKVFIKENTMKLMAEGTADILTEETHIKDALSRIVVEMMKREWPQQWPSLLQELDLLCKQGPIQTELVLLIFLRAAEDVVTFQTVPNQRRREMLQTLTTHMSDIFTFFINTLKDNVERYQALKSIDCGQAQIHCRVAQAVLLTLSGYVDWVTINHVVSHNNLLLEMLCLLLGDDQLQLHVAECLLIITSRKGRAEDRKPLLMLFHEGALSTILKAAVTASLAIVDPVQYLVLKKLCQVLVALGSQLCLLWGSLEGVNQPPNFQLFLEAIMAFTHHPSRTLSSYNQSLWTSFLRHEQISKDPIFLQIVDQLAQGACSTLLKVGYPSQNNSESCQFSRLDFDTDEDFTAFYTKYRTDISEMLRLLTTVKPSVTFECASSWLTEQLKKPVDVGQGDDKELCNLSSPAFLEWDALTIYLDCVMSRIFTSGDKPKPAEDIGIMLLKAVLCYDSQDPLIQSSVLSCISSLFRYIEHAPDTLPLVLDKIFATAVFRVQGQTKATRSRAVQSVRRHACSVLVKICKQYPHLLLPGFDQLYTHIKKLCEDPEELSQMEKITLKEALTLISNEMKVYDKQSCFLGEIMAPTKDIWLSQDMKEALSSPEKFMTYIGLDQPSVEPSSADTCGINRSNISSCVQVLLNLLKRSKWPDSFEEAKAGGFIVQTFNASSALRNPIMPHVIVTFDNVLQLIRTFNALELPDIISRLHPDFAKAYEIMENDRLALFGIQPPVADNTNVVNNKQPLERMQHFLFNTHTFCYHILGNAGQSLGYEFYTLPKLVPALTNSVFSNLSHIPAFKLRSVIRVFLRPFIQHCPKEMCSDIILPLLSQFCPYMYQRLTCEWQNVTSHSENSVDHEEENPESQELLQEQLTRLLSREYMDLLAMICRLHRGSGQPPDGEEEMAMEEENGVATTQQVQDDVISELGALIMQNESLYPSVLWCTLTGLTWNDSSICLRCAGLTILLLKPLMVEQRFSSEDACNILTCILLGLQQHGQHDNILPLLISVALQAYELLRPVYPEIVRVMLLVPNCSEGDLKSFDEKVFVQPSQKPLSDKKKKASFKKLVQEVIGKSIGEKFKKEVLIQNLAGLHKSSKKTAGDVLEEKDLGLCSLFTPDVSQEN